MALCAQALGAFICAKMLPASAAAQLLSKSRSGLRPLSMLQHDQHERYSPSPQLLLLKFIVGSQNGQAWKGP